MSAQQLTLQEIAVLVDGQLTGEPTIRITGLNDLDQAGPTEITFLAKASRQEKIGSTRAAALLVPMGIEKASKPIIRVADPYWAATVVHRHFLAQPFRAAGIHPTAVAGDGCLIPEQVSIGPRVVLGARVRVGQRVVIEPGTVVGDDVVIGDDTHLHANVTICWGSRIGCRVIIQSGTVVGADGFGYATDRRGNHLKRPHTGIVILEDEVELGANVTVDRGTFGVTRIGRGAKIDNLVQIGHNVEVGENSLIVAQVGIAGSARLGRNVVLGGQVGVKGHIALGDRVMVAAQSGVHNSLEAGSIVAGYPAVPHKLWLKASAVYHRLPELQKEVRALKAALGDDK